MIGITHVAYCLHVKALDIQQQRGRAESRVVALTAVQPCCCPAWLAAVPGTDMNAFPLLQASAARTTAIAASLPSTARCLFSTFRIAPCGVEQPLHAARMHVCSHMQQWWCALMGGAAAFLGLGTPERLRCPKHGGA